MSTVTSVVNHWPTANEGFITTLGSTILAGATTVPLTSVSGLTNGTIFVGIIEPGGTPQQVFTGTVDTAGIQITSVVWTRGTNVGHTAGVTIVDYVSGTGQNMMTKGLLVSHDQDGTLKAGAVDNTAALADAIVTRPKLASALGTEVTTGWLSGDLPAVSSVTYNGNRSYDITFASTVASILSSGMRLRTTRTVAGQGYMGGLMNGSSHYFTKVTPTGTLSTVTDNFTIEAHVQPTAYAQSMITGRSDVGATNALFLRMESDGRVTVGVINGAGNSRFISTYQSLPLNKKTHVAASWATGAVVVYFDGISVTVATPTTGGTAPNTAGTAGDFSVGRAGLLASQYFAGYISNVGVFNAVLTAATIRQHATFKLLSSETNCIGAWSLDNVATDATGTNNLTATGGVGYSNTVSPMGNNGATTTNDFALVMNVNAAVATVQVPEGCTIPTSGGVTSVAYSVQGNPYGWVSDKGRWEVSTFMLADSGSVTVGAFSTAYSIPTIATTGGYSITIPVGSWRFGFASQVTQAQTAGTSCIYRIFVNTTSSTTGAFLASRLNTTGITAGTTSQDLSTQKEVPITVTAATTYYPYFYSEAGGGTVTYRWYGNAIGTGDTPRLYLIPSGL